MATQRSLMRHKGQTLIEYAVLVAAVTLGVTIAATAAYRAFVGRAQDIEQNQMVF